MTAPVLPHFGSRSFGPNGGRAALRSLGKPAAAFPGRVATDLDMAIAVDRQQTRLAAPLDSVATSMTVENPAIVTAYNLLSIDNEIVQTTGPPSGNVIPISRGFDGTTPAIHLASTTVSGFIDAYHHNRLVAEIEAIQQTLGANLSRIPSAIQLGSGSFAFAPQTPGGTLNPGANVITLSPVPAGVNGTNTNHYLYISGGTGTAEAVLITGGAAVSEGASGTLIVTCANSHSGAWNIRTATGGIQEAIWYARGQNACAEVYVTQPAILHQKITIPPASGDSNAFTITSYGHTNLYGRIERASDYRNGDLIYSTAGGAIDCALTISDLMILNGPFDGSFVSPNGAAIHLRWGINQHQIHNIQIQNGYEGIVLDCVNNVWITDARVTWHGPYLDAAYAGGLNPPANAGLHITRTSPTMQPPTNIFVSGLLVQGAMSATRPNVLAGIVIESSDGIQITNSTIIQVQMGIWITNLQPYALFTFYVYISNTIIDWVERSSVFIDGSVGNMIQNIILAHCHFDGWPANSGLLPIPAHAFAGVRVQGNAVRSVQVADCVIFAAGVHGIYIEGVPNLKAALIKDNLICDNNSLNLPIGAGITLGANASNVSISGNAIKPVAAPGAGFQNYGIQIANPANDCITITDNDLAGNLIAPLQITPPNVPTNFILADNQGVENVAGSVASGASIALPLNPHFVITGTTGVTAITNQWAGRTGTFVTTGAVTFTAGATIGNTITTVPNRLVTFWSDGTKVYFSQ